MYLQFILSSDKDQKKNLRTLFLNVNKLSSLSVNVIMRCQQSYKTTVLFQGLLENDKVLAAALWSQFFNFECRDAEKLEKLVHYVHKQVNIALTLGSVRTINKKAF